MKVAVEGCCHGELDKIYTSMQRLEKKEGIKIDLLICCGDFQAVRNEDDLTCMSVPDKYKTLGTFYKYYTGEAEAPYPTIFVGGNHEASNYLWELYYGGWVCPNIYFLGYSGVINFGDLRIGGLSGIWKQGDFRRGYASARPPFRSLGDVKSAYHVREYEVWKLSQVSGPLDVFVSHDWPRGVAQHGDSAALFRAKPFLKAEVLDGSLGSQPNAELLKRLAPDYWFSAHLHVKFPALIPRSDARGGATRFLALDKCLPGRNFLQVIDLPHRTPGPLSYDAQWLSILKASHAAMPLGPSALPLPRAPAAAHAPQVAEALAHAGGANVPHNFAATTLALLQLLQLDFRLDEAQQQQAPQQWAPLGAYPTPSQPQANPEELALPDEALVDPDEIELPEEEE